MAKKMGVSKVTERIQAFNRERDPQLLQLKYKLMRGDAFAFLRGTCHLFYEDWPTKTPLNNAPPLWICGDLHWQNLGSYKGDNRLSYFNMNDFDEAVLAPCTWDIARLLVSLLVGAQALHIKNAQAQVLNPYVLEVYTKELRKGHIRNVEEDKASGLVRELLFQVKTRNQKALLDDRTVLTARKRKLVLDGKRAVAVSEEERTAVTAMVEQWGSKQAQPQFFHVLDVAHRIAGVGSLGVERYVVLVEGKGSPDHNLLLDLKAEQSSSLRSYVQPPQPHWHNEAERAVTVQHWVQGVPPAFLSFVEGTGKWYVLRELQPSADKINTQSLQEHADGLQKLVKTIAKVVAWGQLRSAGHQGAAIADDLMTYAQDPRWQDTLLSYAQFYAERVQKDYKEFCIDYDHGAFEA